MELHLYAAFLWALAHTLAAPVLDSPVELGQTPVRTPSPTVLRQTYPHPKGSVEGTGDTFTLPAEEAPFMRENMHQKTATLLDGLHHYDIVVPKLVNHEGDFLSYDVTHKHHLRRKRSIFTDWRSLGDNDQDSDADDSPWIYYKLSAFGSDFHLNLTLNRNLVAPSFVVEYRNSSGVERKHRYSKDCHYYGYLRGHGDSSRVAISNCNGLHGVFSTGGEEFFVEPLWNDTRDLETEGHFHVVYKRSAIKEPHKDNHCGVKSGKNTSPSWWNPISDRSLNQIIKSHDFGHHKKDKWRTRRRRSVSKERFVETLVVADKKMIEHHGVEAIEPYLLTVMNIVAKLYHDASIGNAVNIVVTRLILLTQDQPNLEINYHADRSLESFCHWQHQINPRNNSPASEGIAKHDNAVLLTRYDICTYKNQPCGTLGLAPVAGMCEPVRSCSINEDIGLASAFTVAHEIGHNFGMQHDGAGNKCGVPGYERAKIMAAQLTKYTEPFSWSSCSREYITSFLDAGRGECLENVPPEMNLDLPDELPGKVHDGNEQCRLQYGSRSWQCKFEEVCEELWCTNPTLNDKCVTNNIPAAEGTTCQMPNKENGWCYRGRCKPEEWNPKPVDGQWGPWSEWGSCSRTCGGGVESSERKCNKPMPQDGGKYCVGERKRYKSCKIHDCPINSTDFREIQCQQYNEVVFRGKQYDWKPFFGVGQLKPCTLNCLATGYNFYTERATKVVDGTRCFPDSYDMCINGDCKHVGCDRILGSDAVEDQCRVCGGDGTTCETIEGNYDIPFVIESDSYQEIIVIPQGAVHIKITEKVTSRNYLAMRDSADKYYINGAWTIDWPRNFEIVNTIFNYRRPKEGLETMHALGPTSEDIFVMVLVQEENYGFHYQYNIPINGSENGTEFGWQYAPWSECSVACARGISKAVAVCIRKDDNSIVSSTKCVAHLRPKDKHMYCNEDPCEPEWIIGDWTHCSKTCGGGDKSRSIRCSRLIDEQSGESEAMPYVNCTAKRPRSRLRCGDADCPPHWASDGWSKCQPSCGPGARTRNVYCVSAEGKYQPDKKCEDEKPANKEKCYQGQCPPPSWKTGDWAECSVKCGRGHQQRSVVCKTHNSKPSSECSQDDKPNNVQSCEGTCEAEEDNGTCRDVNKISYCPLVLKFKFCARSYFKQMCCKTCTNAGY